MDTFHYIFCGATAGLLSRLVISPFDVVKIRLQLQPEKGKYTTVWKTWTIITQEEGVLALWKGNAAASGLYFLYGGIQFGSFNVCKSGLEKFVRQSNQQESIVMRNIPVTFVSGAVSGIFATLLTYPLDLLRTRFAVQGNVTIYESIPHACRDILSKEGYSGFYRGLTPAIIAIIPQMGMVFESHRFFTSIFGRIQVKAKDYKSRLGASYDVITYKPFKDVICGGLAGITSKAMFMPLDVIRKRLQVQGPVRKDIVIENVPRYEGVWSCGRQIVKFEGWKGLYKGMVPSVLKAAPSSAITFLVVAQFKRFYEK